MKNICIIGLGYVGLTFGVLAANKGLRVHGIEINKKVVEDLKNYKPHFYELGLESLLRKVSGKSFFVYEEVPKDEDIDAYIVSVGTPLIKGERKPDLNYIQNSIETVAKNLKNKGELVVLRSTLPVGVTRNIVLPILKKYADNFSLAFCPERTIEGKALKELSYLPQIIGGLDEESVKKATDLFREITCTTIRVSSLEAAEMVKLIDNSYRDNRFAFGNEIAKLARALDLNAWELISAANFGYERNDIAVPGFVGGACLVKDPWILSYIGRNAGYIPKLIEEGREVNESLAKFIVERVKQHLIEKNIDPMSAKIVLSGLAFKGIPATDDMRDSVALKIIEHFANEGIPILGHDFVVKADKIRELGIESIDSLEKTFDQSDIVLVLNNHPDYEKSLYLNLIKTMKEGGLLFDSWNVFDEETIKDFNRVIYETLGSR